MDASEMFRVETVEPSTAPDGLPHESWCRYVIVNRHSRVVGRYRGTVTQAWRNAEQLASSANERTQSGKYGWAASSQIRGRSSRARASTLRTKQQSL